MLLLKKQLENNYQNKMMIFRHADKSKNNIFKAFGKQYEGISPSGQKQTEALAKIILSHLEQSIIPVNLTVEYNPVLRTKSLADYIVETTKQITTVPVNISFKENKLLSDDCWDEIYDDYIDKLCDEPGSKLDLVHGLGIGKSALALGLYLGQGEFDNHIYKAAVLEAIGNFNEFVSGHEKKLVNKECYNLVIGTSNSVVMDWYLLSKIPELQKDFSIINTAESFKVENNNIEYRGLISKL